MKINTTQRQQQGTAGMGILAALMVVAVISAIAIKQSWRSDLDISRAGNRWMGMQAKAYSEGAERLAIIALKKDAETNQVDSLDELWASGFDFPTDHGQLQVRIIDAQSRLNINDIGAAYLTNGNGQPLVGPEKYTPAQQRFILLLQSVPISEDIEVLPLFDAEAILEAVKDWVDADSTVSGSYGAERNYYEQLDPPVTIANSAMISISELSQIKGVTPDIYRAILPYVSALPVGTRLNVNTMGPVLGRTVQKRADLTPQAIEDAQTLVEDLASNVPETVQDFVDLPIVDALIGKDANGAIDFDQNSFDIASQYFELHAMITVGDHVRRSRTLIHRSNGEARVVRRSDAHF